MIKKKKFSWSENWKKPTNRTTTPVTMSCDGKFHDFSCLRPFINEKLRTLWELWLFDQFLDQFSNQFYHVSIHRKIVNCFLTQKWLKNDSNVNKIIFQKKTNIFFETNVIERAIFWLKHYIVYVCNCLYLLHIYVCTHVISIESLELASSQNWFNPIWSCQDNP